MRPSLEEVIMRSVLPVGRMLRDNAFEYGGLEWKSKDDPVTDMDKESEWEIKNTILMHMEADFVGEEEGDERNGARMTWYIDPIDGTKSFVCRNFNSAVSLAAEEGGKLVAGCVYDFMREIMYLGVHGETKLLHRERPFPMYQDRLFTKPKLVYDGESYSKGMFEGFNTVERDGSIALTMAQLAAGNCDALVVEPREKSHSYDIAAGYYLLMCTGHEVRSFDGSGFYFRSPYNGVVAYKKHIKDDIESLLF